MADLCEVLDVIVTDDDETRGDFWRVQPWVEIPRAAAVRPDSYAALLPVDARAAASTLAGKRLGVPRMYINADPEAGTNPEGGIGGPTAQRIDTRAPVIQVWEATRRDLESYSAEVVETDHPVVNHIARDHPESPKNRTHSLRSRKNIDRDINDHSSWAWDDFITANGVQQLSSLAE